MLYVANCKTKLKLKIFYKKTYNYNIIRLLNRHKNLNLKITIYK